MILTLVVAMAENRVIGRDGDLPWRLPEDLKHFKRVTMGKPVIMGRRTWDSLYVRPLPGRRNIVVTRNRAFADEGAETAASFDAALALVADTEEAMVIGGAEVFADALPRAWRMHLTEVGADVAGDVTFPDFDRDEWREVSREDHPATDEAPAYSFVVLERQGS